MIIIGGVYVGGCMFIKGGCTCIKALLETQGEPQRAPNEGKLDPNPTQPKVHRVNPTQVRCLVQIHGRYL
jgi:hypothetical protein